DHCNLANLDARGASLVRCELRGCRLTGSAWVEARFTDVLLKDCRIDLAAFTSARFERVTFEDCRLTQSDLQDVACESVRFLGCDLSECDLTDARMRRCELRGCELRGLHDVARLRGAGVAWGDLLELAPLLAGALGIRLLDAPGDEDA
ncbi:MAG TPA: pentapeptide repeat-containing protein, partial [Conexibacter sp.]|nr:pentapeptide repeat-containing protein [Conexibacter sp.]